MYYALLYYPEIKNERFHLLRKKYEPYWELVPEHITFIFPVPESIGLENLESHITTILGSWEPFEIHIRGLDLTWDNFLYYTIKEGNSQIFKLHDEFYTGILSPHLRKDLPFVPHIGVGLFSKEEYDFNNPTAKLNLDEEKYKIGLAEFEDINLDLWRTVDVLTLVKVNTEFTQCDDVKQFKL